MIVTLSATVQLYSVHELVCCAYMTQDQTIAALVMSLFVNPRLSTILVNSKHCIVTIGLIGSNTLCFKVLMCYCVSRAHDEIIAIA